MARSPDANSLSRAQQSLRPPESDPQWSQAAAVSAPLLPPDEITWLCPMLSTDYTPGCHFDDHGTGDCAAADPSDPTYYGHVGIDMINAGGKSIYPVAAGTVVAVCSVDEGAGTFGTWVWVRHSDNTHTRIIDTIYGHMTPDPAITPGLAVTENTLLGTVADPTTGESTGPHLHLSVIVHDVANPDNGWEAGELAGYTPAAPTTTAIYTWGAGHWVNPLEYLFCGNFCCESDIAIAEAPPPPASDPPLPALPSPRWRPNGNFPADGGYNAALHSVDGAAGGWPSWDGTIRTPVDVHTMDVYPFFGGPGPLGGYATVLLARDNNLPGNGFQAEVWLLHSDLASGQMITTWYGIGYWGTDVITLDVQAGDRVMLGTRLARITAASGDAFLEWTVLIRETGDEPFDTAEDDPYSVYYASSVHPACYLAARSGWVDWPYEDYPPEACFEPGYEIP